MVIEKLMTTNRSIIGSGSLRASASGTICSAEVMSPVTLLSSTDGFWVVEFALPLALGTSSSPAASLRGRLPAGHSGAVGGSGGGESDLKHKCTHFKHMSLPPSSAKRVLMRSFLGQ